MIYSCGSKAENQQPLLQSSVSHDPSEIILICLFGAQETLSMLKTVVLLNIFLETVIISFRSFNESNVFKKSIYLKYKSFGSL